MGFPGRTIYIDDCYHDAGSWQDKQELEQRLAAIEAKLGIVRPEKPKPKSFSEQLKDMYENIYEHMVWPKE